MSCPKLSIVIRATFSQVGLALACASVSLYAQELGRTLTAVQSSTLRLKLSQELNAVGARVVPARQEPDFPERLPLRIANGLQQAPAATGEGYVDRLLDASAQPDEEMGVGKEQEEAKGRRFASVDYKLYARSQAATGRSLEQGTGIRYRRETEDYGELYLEAELRNYDAAPNDPLQSQQLRQRFTLSQYHYALSERWQMDNALGVVRSNSNPLVSTSFRIQLPSSIMQGLTSVTYDKDSEWRFIGGNLGKLTGIATQQFDTTKGDLTGVGYTKKFGSNWTASAQLWNLSGNVAVADHQSLAWATQYETSDKTRRFQLHGLHDSKGNNGMWFDGEQRSGLLQHRFGVFHLQPNLLWTDALVPSDLQGGYWRSDFRSQRYNVSGGADFTDNNINNDPARAGNRIANSFLSGFLRVDRTTSVGANLSLNQTNPKFPVLGTASSRTTLMNANLAKIFDFGRSQFQVSHNQTDSSVNPSRAVTLRWDHDWTLSSALQFSTTLANSRENNSGVGATLNTLGILFRQYVSPTFRWDGNITANRRRNDAGETNSSTSASLGGNWSLARNWTALAQLVWNRVDNTNPLSPVFTTDKSLLFTLRYEIASGSPFVQLGRPTGGLGSGRIVGRVFFDDNGDGVRQAVERGVSGLTVLLDGRYPVTTDNDGRFEFGPVATGDHFVTVSLERVPLPWGLLDDSPRRVNVPLRSEGLIEIPLNNLNR